MAVEPTDANESAAAPQGAGSEVLLEDTDLETPSKKRKVCCKIICTLMCMFSIVPNMYRVSHSACVSERVFPTYYKTGDSPFRKKMESLPVAPVTPKSLPRHSRGTPEQLPSSFRAAAELAAARRARETRATHRVALYHGDLWGCPLVYSTTIAPSQRATWRASMSRALWHHTAVSYTHLTLPTTPYV